MKRKSVTICMALLVTALAAMAASKPSFSTSRPSASRPSASSPSVSRPSASTLYNKPASSGGYSKPSSSGGYSKPTPPPSAAPSAPKAASPTPNSGAKVASSGGYSKSTGTVNPTSSQNTPTAFAKGNRFDQSMSKDLRQKQSAASLAALKADKEKFKTPPPSVNQNSIKSNPVVSSAKVYSRVEYHDVVVHRTSFYGGWHPGAYAYLGSPYYGSWDSTFLWWSLMNDSSFFYHHRNDPSIAQWQQDAMRLSEQNGELKGQMAAMNAKLDEMKVLNVPGNDKYLPAAVAKDPTIALSSEAIEAIPVQKPVIRVATGIRGGSYSQIGEKLKNKLPDVTVELVSTSGAEENFKLLNAGKVDAAIVQSDTDFAMSKTDTSAKVDKTFHRATIYCEYVMLVVSGDSPIKSISDLGEANTVYVGPEGSGTALTWSSFTSQNEKYKGVRSQNSDYNSAFEKVGGDKNKALLFVAGTNTPLLNEAAKKGRYRVVPVDDSSLSAVQDKNNHVVYDTLDLPAGTYPGMQNAKLKTLGVDAEWTISQEWIDKMGEGAFDQVNYAIIDIVNGLHQPQNNASAQAGMPAQKASSHWFRWTVLFLAAGGTIYWLVFKFNITGSRYSA